LRLGFVANFISTPVLTGFKAGIGLVIVLDQVPKLLGIHIAKQGLLPRSCSASSQHLPDTALLTLAVAAATLAVLIGMEKLLAALAGAAGRRGRRHRRYRGFFGLQAHGVAIVGLIPQGPALCHPARPGAGRELLPGALGIALMSFTESIAAGRAFAGPASPGSMPTANCSPRVPPISAARCFGAMPAGGGTSQTAVVRAAGGQSQKASLVTAGCRRGDHAAAGAPAGHVAERHAGGGGDRLFGGADPAGRIRAIRKVRTMEFRWA
jgi:SulP family sulfate permease